MEPQFEQTLITHAQGIFSVQYLRILFSSFEEEDFQRFCIKLFTMFKLFLAIISPIISVAPPFEQTLIRHAQGLFVCDI